MSDDSILYPEAYRLPLVPVNIRHAKRSDTHYCFGCQEEMVVKRGQVRREHFAHKTDPAQCNGDNALHEAAKANIVYGFNRAVTDGTDYPLSFPCRGCEGEIRVPVAQVGASIRSEKVVVDGTRSDLVISGQNGVTPRVIIEIVVTHDLETDTLHRYQTAELSVVKVNLSGRHCRS